MVLHRLCLPLRLLLRALKVYQLANGLFLPLIIFWRSVKQKWWGRVVSPYIVIHIFLVHMYMCHPLEYACSRLINALVDPLSVLMFRDMTTHKKLCNYSICNFVRYFWRHTSCIKHSGYGALRSVTPNFECVFDFWVIELPGSHHCLNKKITDATCWYIL